MPLEVDPSQVHSIEVDPSSVKPIAATAPADQPSATSRFLGGVVDAVNPLPALKHYFVDIPSQERDAIKARVDAGDYAGAVHSILTNSVRDLPGMRGIPDTLAAQGQQFVQAYRDLTNTRELPNYGDRLASATGHAAAGLVPFMGPAAAHAGERIGSGDVAGGIGEGIGLIGSVVGPEAVKAGAAKVGNAVSDAKLLPRSGTPEQRAAVDWALSQTPPAPLDAGAATLNPLVRGAQEISGSTIGAGSMAQKAIEARNQWYADKARALADQVRPSPETPETAGAQLAAKGVDTIQAANRTANAAYANYRAYEADPANFREVQTGTKNETRQMATGEVDAQGNPVVQSVSRDVPVKENIPVPVDMRPFKDQFKPVLGQLDRLTRLGQQQYAPAQVALEDLIHGPDFKPASAAEKDLAALKDVSRKNTLTGGVKNEAGALAADQVDKLQSAIDDAVGSVAGPDALGHLRQGRLETHGKYAAIDLVDQFKAEPVKLYQQLTTTKDGAIGLLRQVQKMAPDQIPALGRAYLDGAINHATESGGFDHAAKLFTDWQNLGPQTKKVLFQNPAMISDLDKFFQSAKDSAKVENTSGTAKVNHISGQVAGWTAAAGMTFINPLALAGPALYTIGWNVVARLLYSPRFVRAAIRAMDTPTGTPAAAAAASQLAAAAGNAAVPVSPSGQSAQGTAASSTLAGSATPAAMGSTATSVKVPGEPNNAYRAQYAVKELGDLQASHSGQTFQKNPKYSLENDRDYNNAVNQGKVVGWSSRSEFDPAFHISDNPDAVNGPMVVDSVGNVLGGNGRKMILDRVYQGNPEGAAAYRSLLESKAQQFGIDPKALDSMKQPVLVREVADSEFQNGRTKAQGITDFNKKGTAELTPAEKAISDSKRVSADTLEHVATLLEQEGADATLADVLKSKGKQVLGRLVDDGVVSPQDRAAFESKDGLTDAGKDRISQLMLGRFFADPKQLEAIAPSIRGKVERLAAPLAQVEGRGDWNLTPDMRGAVDILHQAQALGVKNVDDFIKQDGLFGAQSRSGRAIELAKAVQRLNPTELVAAARQYAGDANHAAQGDSLFGGAPDPAESFDAAFGEKAVDAAIAARKEKKNALTGDKPKTPKNSLSK